MAARSIEVRIEADRWYTVKIEEDSEAYQLLLLWQESGSDEDWQDLTDLLDFYITPRFSIMDVEV